MYTKLDLIENQKMNEIIKNNSIRMREHFQKYKRKETKEKIINGILMILGSSTVFIGLMVLIAVIENLRF